MRRTYNADYQSGLHNETKVKRFLASLPGITIEPSTQHEDIALDIDCWVVTEGKRTPVSIKTQFMAQTTGMICLESQVKTALRVIQPDLDIYDSRRYVYQWNDSWLYNGKAEAYVIDTGDDLLLIKKHELLSFIQEGRGVRYIKGNKRSTVEKQIKAGHPHHDARSVLVPVQPLIEQGIATILPYYDEGYDADYTPEGLS